MKKEVENKLLLLKLISLARKVNAQKLNHLVFILEQEGRKERKKTFNYEFVKWNIEPYCMELEKDVEHLLFEKLIKNEQGVCLTEKGKAYIKQSEHLYTAHKTDSFFKFYLYVYLDYPMYQLADFVYKKYELGKYQDKEVVIDIAECDVVRKKLQLEEARHKINLTYKELEKNDEVYMKKIQSIMKELKNEDSINKKNAE